MVDYAMDVYRQLYPDRDIPQNLTDKRVEVVSKLKSLHETTAGIMELFEKPEVVTLVQSSRDGRMLFETLQRDYNFQPEMVEQLYAYAKFQFECGNYQVGAEYLYFVRVLLPPTHRNYFSALWGKLASEILMQSWESAMDEINRLKEVIESGQFTPLQALQHRTWLIHWSLFVFFNYEKGPDLIIDMFLYQPQYLNAIQTQCPHILRYLTTAAITYKNPITEFLECLYVNFDFDGAQRKLRECETV